MINGKPHVKEESASTHRNRSFFVVGVTVLTIIVFFMAVSLITRAIKRSTENQTVDTSSFEELNLKDLLDVAKRTEEQFATLNRQLNDLERSMDNEIRKLTMAYNADVEMVSVERLSQSTRNSRLASLQNKKNYALAEVQDRYSALMLEKQAEIDTVAKALESYDSRLLDQARRNEESLSSERRLFELEKATLTAYYEERLDTLSREAEAERLRLGKAKDELVALLEKTRTEELEESFKRYNPSFDEPGLLSVLERFSVEPKAIESPMSASLLDRGIDASTQLQDIMASLEALKTVSRGLASIPYENSVPSAIAAMNNAALRLSASYEAIVKLCIDLLVREAQATRRLMAELAQSRAFDSASMRELEAYRGAFETLRRASGDAGYVLEVSEESMTIYLDQLGSGAREAWVYRNDMAIARIQLERDGSLFKGVILELVGKETPRPFDKILVRLSKGSMPDAASGGSP